MLDVHLVVLHCVGCGAVDYNQAGLSFVYMHHDVHLVVLRWYGTMAGLLVAAVAAAQWQCERQRRQVRACCLSRRQHHCAQCLQSNT